MFETNYIQATSGKFEKNSVDLLSQLILMV